MADNKYDLSSFDEDGGSDLVKAFGTLDEALQDLEGRVSGTFYGAPNGLNRNCLADTADAVRVDLRCNYEPFEAVKGKYGVSVRGYEIPDVDDFRAEFDHAVLAAAKSVKQIRKLLLEGRPAQLFISGLTNDGSPLSIEVTTFEGRQAAGGR